MHRFDNAAVKTNRAGMPAVRIGAADGRWRGIIKIGRISMKVDMEMNAAKRARKTFRRGQCLMQAFISVNTGHSPFEFLRNEGRFCTSKH